MLALRWRTPLMIVFFAFGVWADFADAEIVVEDDLGRKVILAQPAQRVISLAPHLTELVYAVGGGEKMVATVAWSDFPEAAKSLPVIGSNNKINYEAVLLERPDLVLVWHSGNGDGIVQKLESLGLTVYINEPNQLESIPKTLKDLGTLMGQQQAAEKAAQQFLKTLEGLRQQYSNKRLVNVYYQIWQSPLLTFGGQHLVSDVLTLCGGKNIFADQLALVPRLGVESVLAANPEVIVVGQHEAVEEAFEYWQRWPQLQAIKNGNLYSVNPYHLHRHTPRLLLGAEELCRRLDEAREKPSLSASFAP